MWTCESMRPGMAVAPSASMTTPHPDPAAADAVPTDVMAPCSITTVSPAANGCRQSPLTMVPRLTMAVFTASPAGEVLLDPVGVIVLTAGGADIDRVLRI